MQEKKTIVPTLRYTTNILGTISMVAGSAHLLWPKHLNKFF